MEKGIEKIWVYRKDQKTNQLIKIDRFNPELHKKIFLKNLTGKVIGSLKNTKVDWNNPWVVGLGVGIILIIISDLIMLLYEKVSIQ